MTKSGCQTVELDYGSKRIDHQTSSRQVEELKKAKDYEKKNCRKVVKEEGIKK